MIDAFSTALGTALTAFVSDVSGAITTNLPTVLGVTLGIVGIFLVWRVVSHFASGR
jgi:hypothetical protein